MNDSNHSRRNQDARWAKFLETRQREETSDPPTDGITIERMEDLRTDSMIRKAIELNRESEFEFADRVVNRCTSLTDNEDSTVQLPTPRPAFTPTSTVSVSDADDQPLVTPSQSVTESISINRSRLNSIGDRNAGPTWLAWTIALSAGAAGILIAVLVSTLSDGSTPVAKSTQNEPGHSVQATDNNEPPSSSSENIASSPSVTQSPNLAPESVEQEAPPILFVIGNPMDDAGDTKDAPKELAATDPDEPLVNLAANETELPEAKKPSADKLTPIEKVVAPPVAQRAMTQKIPLKDCQWVMDVNFNSRGMASPKVNQLDLNQAVFHDNFEPVMKNLSAELHRRFAYLEPRLDSKIKGAFVVENQPFTFVGSDQVRAAASNAVDYSKKLSFRNLTPSEVTSMHTMFAMRAQINRREPSMESLQKAILSMTQASPNSQFGFMFATPDEVDLVKHVVARTHQVLQDLAIQRKDWEERNQIAPANILDPLANVPGLDLSIQPTHFDHFVRTGELQLPERQAMASAPLIQDQSAEALKQSLSRFTPAFDIFRSKEEADQASRFVLSKSSSSPEIKGMQAELHRLGTKMRKFTANRLKTESGEKAFASIKKEYDQLNLKIRDLQQKPLEPLKEILPSRPDLQGLPLVMGDACRMEEDRAVSMDKASKFVGETLNLFDRFGTRDENKHDSWRCSILKQKIKACCNLENRTQALSTMDQMLQVDHPRLRTELISALKETGTISGMELISRRAKFDLVPEVRLAATDALREFDVEDVRKTLLEGLEYPWPIVAMHSAEAIVRLKDVDAADDLIEFLEMPNPRKPIKLESGGYVQKELVAINHMKNCLLCHAPSTNTKDYGRGLTPTWESPLPQRYYQSSSGAFVRADVTYLRQDFSVMQPVENHGQWPKMQRFDYVIQNKKLSAKEAQAEMRAISRIGNPNREAVVFALQSLTGKKAKNDTKDEWTKLLEQFKLEQKSNP